jgi:hypothetical protein
MLDFEHKRYNPLELIQAYWPDAYTDHITYNPQLRQGDFEVIRGNTSDGTLWFSREMMQRALVSICNMRAAPKDRQPDPERTLTSIEYELGPMRHAIVFGNVDLPVGRYPGLRERVRMWVKCKYIYEEAG